MIRFDIYTHRAPDIGTSESPVSKTQPRRTSPYMSPWLRRRARRKILPNRQPKTVRKRRRPPPPSRNRRPKGHTWCFAVSSSRFSVGIFFSSEPNSWRIWILIFTIVIRTRNYLIAKFIKKSDVVVKNAAICVQSAAICCQFADNMSIVI